MPALTFKGKIINISFTFDTLTIYPTFAYYKSPGLRNCLDVVQDECNKLQYVVKVLPNQEPTQENHGFIKSIEQVQENKYSAFDRIIRRKDDDHGLLYHDDEYKLDDSHWHIKFKEILDPEKTAKILSIFVKHKILSEEEKNLFLQTLNKRHQDNIKFLNTNLTKDPIKDTKVIINFIINCCDNDILGYLHNYLLNEKAYDYLREMSKEDLATGWQGTARDGNITHTSRSWAMIEKFISLKLATNIQKGVSKFSPEVGVERARQLAQEYRFFSIKRKSTAQAATSNIYEAFLHANGPVLDSKLNKMVSKL